MAQALSTHRTSRQVEPSAVLDQPSGSPAAAEGAQEMDTLVQLLDLAITRRVTRGAGTTET